MLLHCKVGVEIEVDIRRGIDLVGARVTNLDSVLYIIIYYVSAQVFKPVNDNLKHLITGTHVE